MSGHDVMEDGGNARSLWPGIAHQKDWRMSTPLPEQLELFPLQQSYSIRPRPATLPTARPVGWPDAHCVTACYRVKSNIYVRQ